MCGGVWPMAKETKLYAFGDFFLWKLQIFFRLKIIVTFVRFTPQNSSNLRLNAEPDCEQIIPNMHR